MAFLRGLIAGHGDEDDSEDYYDDEFPDEDIYIEDDEEVMAPASRPRKRTKARDDGDSTPQPPPEPSHPHPQRPPTPSQPVQPAPSAQPVAIPAASAAAAAAAAAVVVVVCCRRRLQWLSQERRGEHPVVMQMAYNRDRDELILSVLVLRTISWCVSLLSVTN